MVSYYQLNGTGGVVGQTNTAGEMIKIYQYDACGEELLTVGSIYYQEIYLSDERQYFLSVQPRKRFTENSIRKEQGRPLRAMY